VTLANWCRRKKIAIKAEKSKALFITTPLPPLTFENKVTPWRPQAKYLGSLLTISSRENRRKLYRGEGQSSGSNSLSFTLCSKQNLTAPQTTLVFVVYPPNHGTRALVCSQRCLT
jgi:hypothetical protein